MTDLASFQVILSSPSLSGRGGRPSLQQPGSVSAPHRQDGEKLLQACPHVSQRGLKTGGPQLLWAWAVTPAVWGSQGPCLASFSLGGQVCLPPLGSGGGLCSVQRSSSAAVREASQPRWMGCGLAQKSGGTPRASPQTPSASLTCQQGGAVLPAGLVSIHGGPGRGPDFRYSCLISSRFWNKQFRISWNLTKIKHRISVCCER